MTTGAALHIAVVGGGLSGMSAAWALRPAVREGRVQVDLFEASSRLGGTVETDRASGHPIEKGPDSFLTRKPEALALAQELGLASSLMGARGRNLYLYSGRRFHPLPPVSPLGIPSGVATLWRSDLFSARGKLRAAWDLLCPRSGLRPGGPDVSVGSFLRRRLGDEVVDRLVAPLAGGVHLTDIDLLSLQTVFPQLLRLENEHRSLILASARQPKPAGAGGPAPFVTLRGGLDLLVSTLASQLPPVTVHTGTAVQSLRREGSSWTLATQAGEAGSFDGIVLALPPSSAGSMLRSTAPDLSNALEVVPYSPVVAVGLVLGEDPVPPGLDGSGFLVPRTERSSISGVTWIDRKWDLNGNAPGHPVRVYLRAEGPADVGGRSDPETVDLAVEELRRLSGLALHPMYSAVYRHPRALPQYRVGHLDWVTKVRTLSEAVPGLALAGAAYEGVGLSDCIRSGRRAALSLLTRTPAS